jgi:sugar transferase (PEP-CTERM/EpsH1 system associated)
MNAADKRLLVAHVVYRFDVGGLENGVANLLDRLPEDRFRHAVVAMTEVTDFRRRVRRGDIHYISLHKGEGHGFRLWPALYRTFRALRPDIVHTRNLAPLEASVPALAAGVPARVHGEHGWDVGDLAGANRANRLTRRLYRPFVSHYIALSRHIESYLTDAVGVPPAAVTQIYNGVDTARFAARSSRRQPIAGCPFVEPGLFVIGTVGRLVPVKDQAALIRALARLQRASTVARERMRLAIVGEGPLARALHQLAMEEGVAASVWMPGARDDVAQVMAGLDVFVLPSLAEGISNTLLEAMSCGRASVATAVGGNAELIDDGASGTLVPPGDGARLDAALLGYMQDEERARRHGAAARAAVEARFSLDRMAADYAAVYERVASRGCRAAPATDGAALQARGHH